MQLEPASDAATSNRKQTQLEEDLYTVTEIEQRLLDAFPPDDRYFLMDNMDNMDTRAVLTSQPYLRVLGHLQNIATRESSAMPVAGIISVEECDALMRVCVCRLSLLSFLILLPTATGEGSTGCGGNVGSHQSQHMSSKFFRRC